MNNIQFSHANGFGLKTYTHFLSFLKPYEVKGVELIGHGQYSVVPNWKPVAKELIEHIEKNNTAPVIGIGHSLGGAVTLYAAQERPDLFKQVIFLDPPLFGGWKRKGMMLMKFLGQLDKVGPSGLAKKRREFFPTKEEAFKYFSSKKFFDPFDRECFKNYVEFGLKPSKEHGFELAFSKETEYQVFRELPFIKKEMGLKIPSHFIYSNQHKVLSPKDIQWLKPALVDTQFIEFDGGHLFPLEQPNKTAQLIKSLIIK
jgi:pimeloyl-ACP methyl ester carboxylesterase